MLLDLILKNVGSEEKRKCQFHGLDHQDSFALEQYIRNAWKKQRDVSLQTDNKMSEYSGSLHNLPYDRQVTWIESKSASEPKINVNGTWYGRI
jgi:hypothetical protein